MTCQCLRAAVEENIRSRILRSLHTGITHTYRTGVNNYEWGWWGKANWIGHKTYSWGHFQRRYIGEFQRLPTNWKYWKQFGSSACLELSINILPCTSTRVYLCLRDISLHRNAFFLTPENTINSLSTLRGKTRALTWKHCASEIYPSVEVQRMLLAIPQGICKPQYWSYHVWEHRYPVQSGGSVCVWANIQAIVVWSGEIQNVLARNDGKIPLHEACSANHLSVISLMLEVWWSYNREREKETVTELISASVRIR